MPSALAFRVRVVSDDPSAAIRETEDQPGGEEATGAPAPEPLEAYAVHFDPVFSKLNQREALRQYRPGCCCPWFLSESTWDAEAINTWRLELLCSDARTAQPRPGCW